MTEDLILTEIRETNRLLQKLLTHEIKAHDEWKEHIKGHDKLVQAGNELQDQGKKMLGVIKDEDMADFMKTISEAMKHSTQELKDKQKDDAAFRDKLKGFKRSLDKP